MTLATRILDVLDTGPRKPSVLRGVAKARGFTQADFERAIGWLFLKGMIVAQGKTSGRLIARNGRRRQTPDDVQ